MLDNFHYCQQFFMGDTIMPVWVAYGMPKVGDHSLLPLELLGQHSAHANAAGICIQDKN